MDTLRTFVLWFLPVWCIVYICESIFVLRIYVAVTSPYSQDQGVTPFESATNQSFYYSIHVLDILTFLKVFDMLSTFLKFLSIF